ncbi:hypothetical protein ACFSTC_41275 [Nonomuraea ferruginea]
MVDEHVLGEAAVDPGDAAVVGDLAVAGDGLDVEGDDQVLDLLDRPEPVQLQEQEKASPCSG